MTDYLLQYDGKDDQLKQEMMNMLKNLDSSDINVLETYLSKDIGKVCLVIPGVPCLFCNYVDMAENLLDHHINSNGFPDRSERFMLCLDLSPTIPLHNDIFHPITNNKKKILLHPIINTYIMMKYSCYAIIFIFILINKTIFASLLSCVAIMDLNKQNNETLGEDHPASEGPDYSLLSVIIFTIGTTNKHQLYLTFQYLNCCISISTQLNLPRVW